MPRGARLVLAAFAVSGCAHVLTPGVYEPLVPGWLPARRVIVVGSGVAELVCAAGLAARRPWAPKASAALLVAVWPGNWSMALDAQRRPGAPQWLRAALWVRLPLQLPMVRAVLSADDGSARGTGP